MRFSIITPTYKRPELLKRAVDSVRAQTYQDWEMIIINDSPNDAGYTHFASHINDPRIHYHVNHTNSGVNFSRNRALEKLSAQSDWVILLDDDDYLSPDALATFKELIETHPHESWFITNRAYKDGTPITKIKKSDTDYSYALDYLLLKRCQGDATHCMRTDLLHGIRFSKHIKNGEEWIFFYELGLKEKMFYRDHNSTISDGYAQNGLNFRNRSRKERFKTLFALSYEGAKRNLWYHPTFFIYILIRMITTLVRA